MNGFDRVLSVAILLAAAAALYLVWLDRGEIELISDRLDTIDRRLDKPAPKRTPKAST